MNLEQAIALLEETFNEPHATVTINDLVEELKSPDTALWLGDKSVVFLRLSDHHETGERVLEASPAAGDLAEILDRGTKEIEQLARDNKCSQIHVRAGRGGWERALKQHGYEVTAIIMRKLLVN